MRPYRPAIEGAIRAKTRPGTRKVHVRGMALPDPGNHDLSYTPVKVNRQSLYLTADPVVDTAKDRKGR